jgi:hypothetical protein
VDHTPKAATGPMIHQSVRFDRFDRFVRFDRFDRFDRFRGRLFWLLDFFAGWFLPALGFLSALGFFLYFSFTRIIPPRITMIWIMVWAQGCTDPRNRGVVAINRHTIINTGFFINP